MARRKKQKEMLHVYVILCPLTHGPKYVGITRDPERRLKEIVSGNGRDTPLRAWIRELIAYAQVHDCLPPRMVVIEKFPPHWAAWDINGREKHWIKRISGNVGSQLLNVVHGPQPSKRRSKWRSALLESLPKGATP